MLRRYSMNSSQALSKLMEGNNRYVETGRNDSVFGKEYLKDLAENGQHPFACVICCADSRVVPENIFSVNIGEIFTIRNAGNVIDNAEIGSAEYAALHLHVPLILVLGHTKCGAVQAALSGNDEGNIGYIASRIKKELGGETDPRICSARNAVHGANTLKESPILSKLISEEKLRIAVALYDVDTGKVSF